MKGIWKSVLGSVLVVIVLAVLGFFLKDVLVGKIIVPIVVESLEKEGHVQELIKDGRYIAVDQKAFASNYTVSSKNAIQLFNGELLSYADLDTMHALTCINRKIDTLKCINNTLCRGCFKITLYCSDLDSDQGYLVLNRENYLIQHFLKHLERYIITAPNGYTKEYTVRLERVKEQDQWTSEAVGRLPRGDFDEFFSSVGRGIGTAEIYISYTE